MKRNTIAAITALLLTTLPALCGTKHLPEWKEGFFDIHAIATGKGEQTLLIMPDGTKMLIDAGDMTGSRWNGKAVPDSSKTPAQWVARYIKRFTGSSSIDYFLLTHLHADHMGSVHAFRDGSHGYKRAGITELADYIEIGKLVDRAYPDYDWPSKEYISKLGPMPNYLRFIGYRDSLGLKAEKFIVGSHSQFSPVHKPDVKDFDVWNIAGNAMISTGNGLEVRKMYDDTTSPLQLDENLFSTVLLFRYGNFTYYHGGDIGGSSWPSVNKEFDRDFESGIADFIGHPVTVIKADHHATRDSSNPYFLWKMRPRQIIVHAIEAKHCWPSTINRMLDPQMPGCKEIFATGDSGKACLDDATFAKLKGVGHIVVRVYEGGAKYKIYVLDNHSKDYRVLWESEMLDIPAL